MRPNLRLGRKIMPVRIARIREPEVSGQRILNNIIERSEFAAEKRIEQHLGLVGAGVDDGQFGVVVEISLVAEDDGLAFDAVGRGARGVVGGAAVGLRDVGIAMMGHFVGFGVDDGDVDGVV